MTTDPVMTEAMHAQDLANRGERDAARIAFTDLWDRLGPDRDPLHAVTIAHYLADLQDDPAEELAWDLRALAAADGLTDERAQRYHATLQVRGFAPSLHLNLAADYTKVGDRDAARRHLARAEDAVDVLGDDGYGRMIRGGIDRLRAELE
ncbi:hypothetical protein GCM10023094_44740 [Rhodococcus olei]|uniref:Tetratricopeptide repeat protein n=1 Tax=Rhodococcus olei TaxID=2161675 RepID=A0ABP8PJG5_9NOCA